ncbi:MAG: methyltransferase domain-containing protein [Nitrospinae bacterium]|nr:methyltransferase domain-containing protein [Nitrospinota bacterium]
MKTSVFHRKTLHLNEHQLFPPDNNCPFCLSTNREAAAVLQKEPDVYILACKNCYAASASRMPTQEALIEYYRNFYDNDEDTKVTFDNPERLALHILSYYNDINADEKNVQILDFGGGDSTISAIMAERMIAQDNKKEVYITVIDYNTDIKKLNNQRIKINRVNDLFEAPDNTYTIVIASAIIEHIPKPREILIKLFNVLERGAIFYARTPYILPLLKLSNSIGLHLDFAYPAHLHDLGARFWKGLTQRLSCKGEFKILRSTPSITETSFREHFFRTLAAYTLKVPGYIFKETYGLAGGWEIFIKKNNSPI